VRGRHPGSWLGVRVSLGSGSRVLSSAGNCGMGLGLCITYWWIYGTLAWIWEKIPALFTASEAGHGIGHRIIDSKTKEPEVYLLSRHHEHHNSQKSPLCNLALTHPSSYSVQLAWFKHADKTPPIARNDRRLRSCVVIHERRHEGTDPFVGGLAR